MGGWGDGGMGGWGGEIHIILFRFPITTVD